MGVWDAIPAGRLAPFGEMQVWDGSGGGCIRFSAREVGQQEMGCVVENSVLLAALADTLRSRPGSHVDFVTVPAGLASLDLPGRGEAGSAVLRPSVVPRGDGGGPAEAPAPLSARLVVGADGGQSQVRALAGLRTAGWAYGQSAVVGSVRTAEASVTAWQRYLPSGPLALLPVWGGAEWSNVVWTTSPARARQLRDLSDGAFAAAVDAALQVLAPVI